MWLSWIIEAVQPMGAILIGMSLLGLLISFIPFKSAQLKMRVLGTYVVIMFFSAYLFGAVLMIPGPRGPDFVRLGPSKTEMESRVDQTMWNFSKVVPQGQSSIEASKKLSDELFPTKRLVWPIMGVSWLFVIWLVVRVVRTKRLLDKSEMADSSWQDLANAIYPDFLNKMKGKVYFSREIEGPMAIALAGKGSVVLPYTANEWSLESRRAVLTHEIVHLKDQHPFAVGFSETAAIFAWYAPWAWWLAARVRRTAEFAADEASIEMGIDPAEYAEALLLVAKGRNRFVSGIAMSSCRDFKTRVNRVLTQRPRPYNRWSALSIGVALSLLAGTVVGVPVRAYAASLSLHSLSPGSVVTLDRDNGFETFDATKHIVSVDSVLMKRNGKNQIWRNETGWKVYKPEAGNLQRNLDSGQVLVKVDLGVWPKFSGDRAYSLSAGNAVAYGKLISILLPAGTNDLSLTYSREAWKEVGRTGIGQKPTGRFSEFNRMTYGLAKSSDKDREFSAEYSQIVLPSKAPFEISYDWKQIDRSKTDRRVIFEMKNGERVVGRQYVLKGANPVREAWRAYVDAVNIKGFVIQERPALSLDIKDLPTN